MCAFIFFTFEQRLLRSRPVDFPWKKVSKPRETGQKAAGGCKAPRCIHPPPSRSLLLQCRLCVYKSSRLSHPQHFQWLIIRRKQRVARPLLCRSLNPISELLEVHKPELRGLCSVVFAIRADHRGDPARTQRDWKLFIPLTSTYRMVGISASFQCKWLFCYHTVFIFSIVFVRFRYWKIITGYVLRCLMHFNVK